MGVGFMDKSKLTNKHALIKVAGVGHSLNVDISSADESGIWLQNESLRIELISLIKEEGKPIFLKDHPLIFLPYAQIDWLMVAAQDVR
jgi:hypothetical protein